MDCFIYRSNCKEGAYLYLEKENDFSQLPVEFHQLFGKPEFVMKITLNESRKLVVMESQQLKKILQEEGFFLHLSDEFHHRKQK